MSSSRSPRTQKRQVVNRRPQIEHIMCGRQAAWSPLLWWPCNNCNFWTKSRVQFNCAHWWQLNDLPKHSRTLAQTVGKCATLLGHEWVMKRYMTVWRWPEIDFFHHLQYNITDTAYICIMSYLSDDSVHAECGLSRVNVGINMSFDAEHGLHVAELRHKIICQSKNEKGQSLKYAILI